MTGTQTTAGLNRNLERDAAGAARRPEWRTAMTTQQLPGAEAARHGTWDADLTVMLAAHDAFRRDLVSLARAASAADRADPRRREQVGRGWQVL